MSHRKITIQPPTRTARRQLPANPARPASRGNGLFTPAELRVLHYLPTHLSNAEIAASLQVATTTVKTQVSSIYRKLGVARRSQAVAVARDLQVLDQ